MLQDDERVFKAITDTKIPETLYEAPLSQISGEAKVWEGESHPFSFTTETETECAFLWYQYGHKFTYSIHELWGNGLTFVLGKNPLVDVTVNILVDTRLILGRYIG